VENNSGAQNESHRGQMTEPGHITSVGGRNDEKEQEQGGYRSECDRSRGRRSRQRM
jgi:hypothetical protein